MSMGAAMLLTSSRPRILVSRRPNPAAGFIGALIKRTNTGSRIRHFSAKFFRGGAEGSGAAGAAAAQRRHRSELDALAGGRARAVAQQLAPAATVVAGRLRRADE